MSKPKGPKIDLPQELEEELDSGAPDARARQETPEATLETGTAAAAEGDSGAEAEAEAPSAGSPARERDDLKDRYLRLAAEFENFKRRALKERQDLFNYANEALIKDLLETVDNLERALDHAQGTEEGFDAKTLLEGVELTLRGLLHHLAKAGVQVVEASGEPFDPRVHEAVGQVESGDHSAGTVMNVHQKGYLLKDRLLRPALVTVSRRSEGE